LNVVKVPYILYGEIYGSRVQKEILYTKDIKFSPFDLKTEDGFYDYNRFKEVCKDIFDLPPEIFKADSKDTLVEKIQTIDNIKGNLSNNGYIIEGVVVRNLSPGDRVILKEKTKQFKEEIKAPKQKIIGCDHDEFMLAMYENLTPQRLSNVISKEGLPDLPDDTYIKHVRNELIKDAKEYIKDEYPEKYNEYDKVAKKTREKIYKKLEKYATYITKNYFYS
jgi:hypothetical protein